MLFTWALLALPLMFNLGTSTKYPDHGQFGILSFGKITSRSGLESRRSALLRAKVPAILLLLVPAS